MKITVITDVAQGGPLVTLGADEGQTLHELDRPAEYESTEPVEALHEALRRHLAG